MKALRVTFGILAVTALCLGSYVGLIIMTPATVWFQPNSLTVVQIAPGEVPTVVMNRAINFTFYGRYTVDVRNVETGLLACGMGGAHRYKAGLHGEYTLPLNEFAGGDTRCTRLRDGVYSAETCWTVLYPIWGLLPPKTACITSNPFRVTK